VGKIISLLLILVSLLPRFANIALMVDYKVNYQQYLETCENKNKPELKCDGKCHLKAMFPDLVSNTNENLPEPPALETVPEITLFVNFLLKTESNALENKTNSIFHLYNFSLQENLEFDLFVPPKLF